MWLRLRLASWIVCALLGALGGCARPRPERSVVHLQPTPTPTTPPLSPPCPQPSGDPERDAAEQQSLYDAQRMPGSFGDSSEVTNHLAHKAERLMCLLGFYRVLVKRGALESRICALVRIGQAYRAFAAFVRSVPVPAEFTGADRARYTEALEERAAKVDLRGDGSFRRALEFAGLGGATPASSPCAEQARAALADRPLPAPAPRPLLPH